MVQKIRNIQTLFFHKLFYHFLPLTKLFLSFIIAFVKCFRVKMHACINFLYIGEHNFLVITTRVFLFQLIQFLIRACFCPIHVISDRDSKIICAPRDIYFLSLTTFFFIKAQASNFIIFIYH